MTLTANTKGTNDTLATALGPKDEYAWFATTCLCVSTPTAITPGATTTALLVIPIPFECTVQKINVANITSAGGASRPTYNFASTTLAANLIASAATITAGDITETTAGSTPALLNNQLTKGDLLTFNLTTVADEVVTGITVVITVVMTSQALTDATYR